MRSIGLITAALALVLVAGCAGLPVEPSAGAGAPDPHELTQWVAKGRIALVAQGEGGSGSFVWQQRSERTELTVRGPLGAGGLRIVTDGEMLELEDGSGQQLDGEAARRAIEARLGTNLPLAELRYWMLGIPAPERPGMGPIQQTAGSVPGFVQGAWVVSYEQFQPARQWLLPARMTAFTGDVKVRMVVDDWQFPAQ
jgi:outer membrane lipoprotein LolB